jgi:mRNA-degrading endonuclease RelE of RelBE toxin-antitoxin system
MNSTKKIEVLQTPMFAKRVKKLHKNQKKDLDKAITEIIKDPKIGTQKKGNLSDVWVYKFKMVKQENLLAYQWDSKTRKLIALGVHENFYRDIE